MKIPFRVSSHSQTVCILQPRSTSADCFLLSLSTFLSNFCFQKSVLVFGNPRFHVGHLCQKQPCTNIARFLPG